MTQTVQSQMATEKKGDKKAQLLAWSLAALPIIIGSVALVLSLSHLIADEARDDLISHYTLTPIIAVVYAIIGALVAARHPKNAIGWLFLAVSFLSALQGAAGAARSGSLSGTPAQLARWLGIWIWMPVVFIPTMIVFLLFPDGRLLSTRWRPLLWSAVLGILLSVVAMALHPGPLESWGIGPGNPFGIPAVASVLEVIALLAQLFVAIGIGGAIVAFVARFRRSTGLERQQMKWLLYALTLVVVGVAGSTVAWALQPERAWVASLGYASFSLAVLAIAVAAGIAILRHQMYDINLVINHTLVYGALTISIVTLYALIVGGLSAVFQARGNSLIALLATGAIAVLFQPLRGRLQRGVNRLFYGQRDDPLKALSQLGRRLETTLDPEVVLPTLVETIAQTLKLPYVAISLQSSDSLRIVAQVGESVPGIMTLPLIYRGETLGQLMAGPRRTGELFSPEDRRLLETIVHQAGPAVHAVQLTAALQHSRLQLVTAREEERRRLRRDLHDGLGATLAALHLAAGVLRRSLRSDPAEAEALVDEFRGDIRATIDDIRRLVYELRPPTLDQLGLVAAVRAQAIQCSLPESNSLEESMGPALQVNVEAPEEFPPLPAAVEVAAYRIIQEALTNVVHHAQASHCLVRLELADELKVEILDDGLGLFNGRSGNGGLGLVSMQERASELGGTCLVELASGGGTRVLASLPLPKV